MWRASMASSRTVILFPGSGRPLELAKVERVRPSSRARLVIMSVGEAAFIAGHAFRKRDAGIVAALDDGAVQQIVDRDLAVDGGEHGRGARRRAARAPGILADVILVGQLDVAFLEGMEHGLRRHQLHHAGRRAQFVGILLEQHAAAGRLDQDRGRRVAVEAAVFLGALHALVGGIAPAAAADRRPRQ